MGFRGFSGLVRLRGCRASGVQGFGVPLAWLVGRDERRKGFKLKGLEGLRDIRLRRMCPPAVNPFRF